MEPDKKSNLLIPGSIIVAGVIIALSIAYVSGPPRLMQSPPPSQGSNPPPSVASADLLVNSSSPQLGNPDAPVTVVEFSDFQCPFCNKFHQTVEPKIIEEYVRKGKVRFVYRDFPFLDSFPGVPEDQKESHWASEAARCAGDQGKYWEYHDYLFDRQSGENQGAFIRVSLKLFAATLKLNTTDFNACLDSDKYASAVEKDKADGVALGVNSTPTTFVNGVMVASNGDSVGAAPYEVFKALIDAALAGK